jgi:NADPH-dependent 2,4-dienoyl-CoA reductase/sulfur reductase-like enzyme
MEWLNGLDLMIDQGIVVDEHLRSSAQHIYAAGDVAQALDKSTNQKRVMPILPNASIQGRIAGMNMAGKDVPYPGGLAFNSIPLCGMNIATRRLGNIDDTRHEILTVQRGIITGALCWPKIV